MRYRSSLGAVWPPRTDRRAAPRRGTPRPRPRAARRPLPGPYGALLSKLDFTADAMHAASPSLPRLRRVASGPDTGVELADEPMARYCARSADAVGDDLATPKALQRRGRGRAGIRPDRCAAPALLLRLDHDSAWNSGSRPPTEAPIAPVAPPICWTVALPPMRGERACWDSRAETGSSLVHQRAVHP